MLCYVTLRFVTLRYVTLRYVTLRYVTLCYVMLCYVMLCYVMLKKMQLKKTDFIFIYSWHFPGNPWPWILVFMNCDGNMEMSTANRHLRDDARWRYMTTTTRMLYASTLALIDRGYWKSILVVVVTQLTQSNVIVQMAYWNFILKKTNLLFIAAARQLHILKI